MIDIHTLLYDHIRNLQYKCFYLLIHGFFYSHILCKLRSLMCSYYNLYR
ncbi:Uncharacterised protein [Vibrio cholerae]|nr:Uncharacterised protein [Vibrio cholerae]CSB52363.1 Uncharacterised protein [Vibrio cholerae]CSC92465.1 Uncharacterised protein [Vibrio cholerae]